MARINTNVSSLIARQNLNRANADLTVRLQRLSTGLRINRGADDPAGLIVSERLRTEISGLHQAIDNSERASSVIATTEGYLDEVAGLLNSIKSLVIEASNTGGVSREEIEANQLQIDSAIDSINRIASTATFAGLRLLDGSLQYQTSVLPTSAIADVELFNVQLGNASSRSIAVEVVSSAQAASLFLSGNTSGSAGALLSSVSIEIAGEFGVQTLSFVSGTTMSAVVAAVNTVRDSTGVSAALVSGSDQTSGLTFNSVSFGSDSFVSVRQIGDGGAFFGVFDQQGGTEMYRDEGQDVLAIVNGTLAQGKGRSVSVNTPSLGVELSLTTAFAQTTGVSRSFDVTGGGATFQLGPATNATQQVGFGLRSVAASRLGGTEASGVLYFLDAVKAGGDFNLLDGDLQVTEQVVSNAIEDIAVLRGRLGAFERNTLETNIRSLQIGLENITASESRIRDADFAEEISALTRAQILSQAGTSVLATANASAQSVLALLG